MDKKHIPHGGYCYTWLEYPHTQNNLQGKVKHCPYHSTHDIDPLSGYCHYMDEEVTDFVKVCDVHGGYDVLDEADRVCLKKAIKS